MTRPLAPPFILKAVVVNVVPMHTRLNSPMLLPLEVCYCDAYQLFLMVSVTEWVALMITSSTEL